MIKAEISNFLRNAFALILALIVHALLFGLIGLSSYLTKPAKLIAEQPMQAVVITDLPDVVSEPEVEPEPVVEEIKQPKPEPEPVVEEKPKPKPKDKFKYECDGVVYEVDSKTEADRLQAECDAKLKAKKQEEEKKKLQAEKEKAEKKKQGELKKKKLDEEKKRKEEKKRQAELKKEQARKKAEEEKTRKQKEAEVKRKRGEKAAKEKAATEKAAKEQAIADQHAQEAALQEQINADRIKGEKNAAWRAADSRIKQAINSQFNLNLFSTDLKAYYEIQLQPGGYVVNVKLKRSSGNALYDEEGRRAILKASPLPIPTDLRYFDSTIDYDHANY